MALALAACVAMGTDPSLRAGFRRMRIGIYQNSPAGVFTCHIGDNLRGFSDGGGILRVDHKIDERRACFCVVAGFPEFSEFLVDLADFNRNSA